MAIYKNRQVSIIKAVTADAPRVKIQGETGEEIVSLKELQLTREEADRFRKENTYDINEVQESKVEPKTEFKKVK